MPRRTWRKVYPMKSMVCPKVWCVQEYPFNLSDNKQKIFSTFKQSKETGKRQKKGQARMRIRVFFKWFKSKRSQQITIDGPMPRQMAIDFANKQDFKASDGWLTNWKERLVLLQVLYFSFFGIIYGCTLSIYFLNYQCNNVILFISYS